MEWMMDWMMMGGLGTAGVFLLVEFHDFIRDGWGRGGRRYCGVSGASGVSGAFGAPGRRWPLEDRAGIGGSAMVPAAAPPVGIGRSDWQSTARRLAGQWTVMDGVMARGDAPAQRAAAGGRDARTATPPVRTRALSPDQILSARIEAAYAVWAAARSSQR